MRLDIFLYSQGRARSRETAKKMILDGHVSVNGKRVIKPSFDISEKDCVDCTGGAPKFVSRGGDKLEAALLRFDICVQYAVCIDFGASSGGFTDCLLRHGARQVYALDSGSSQLASALRSDSRVVSYENFNARYLRESSLCICGCDIAVMDVSFISQTLLYDSVSYALKDGGIFLSLIKPQFEVGRENIGKKGIVKDKKLHKNTIVSLSRRACEFGFYFKDVMRSPIAGGDGNTEYLALFIKQEGSRVWNPEAERLAERCVNE